MKLERLTSGHLPGMIFESLYRELADELAVDKWVPKMKAAYLLKMLVFSILHTKYLHRPRRQFE